MKKANELNQIEQPNISEFLLKDTLSLRNEKDFTNLADMVHPLTYTDDLKKNKNMRLIPIMDKHKDDNFVKLINKLLE